MIELPATITLDTGEVLYAGGADTARDGKNWYFTGDVLEARVFIDCQFSLFDEPAPGLVMREPRDLRAYVTAHAMEQALRKRAWMSGADMDAGQPFHPEGRW